MSAVLTAEELDVLVTTTDAANLAKVTVAAVSQWRRRGLLPVTDRDERGRPLYRWIDVARAEAKTRQRARRTFTGA
ncbi:MAG: helix-turn-helix domain-containing protein [Pseudonocardia sp.]|nr:helix-turn-helix domain-containing protein [Pseudonocardia sp.]